MYNANVCTRHKRLHPTCFACQRQLKKFLDKEDEIVTSSNLYNRYTHMEYRKRLYSTGMDEELYEKKLMDSVPTRLEDEISENGV